MDEHVQRYNTLTDVAERAGGDLSGMQGLMDLFSR